MAALFQTCDPRLPSGCDGQALAVRSEKEKDNCAAGWKAAVLPTDALAFIRPVERNLPSSGRARMGDWRLEFEPRAPPSVDPLTGWTGGRDPLAHLALRFPDRLAAIRYCERNGLAYEMRERSPSTVQLQAYRPFEAKPPTAFRLPPIFQSESRGDVLSREALQKQ